jgi:hypothetical protein
MSIKETQIDWASKEFSKAAKAVERDSGLYHIAVGLSHLCQEIKVLNYRISRLEEEKRLPELDD